MIRFWIDELKEGLAIAFTAIRANKMRSALTTLGIVIGIVSVTLMGTAIEGLNQAFTRSVAIIGADVLYVQKWPWGGGGNWWEIRNRKDLLIQHAKAIEDDARSVASVSPIMGTRRNVTYAGKVVESVTVIGTDDDFIATTNANVDLGRFMTSMEANGGRPVCVLGSEVAEALFPNEFPIGKVVKVGAYPYRVVGVLEKQGSFLGLESFDNRVYVPINRFFSEFMSRRGGIQIWVKAASLETVDETREEIRGILRKVRKVDPGAQDDFAINQQEFFIQTFNTIGGIIAAVGLFITGLSLFVGGIGIMNIMFVSVTERTKEIGIRKAIGAPKRAILLQFLLESAVICLIGGVVGLMISFPLSLIIDQILPTAMPVSIVVVAILISLFVGVVSGFLPAYRASRMDPVDALRYE